MKRCPNLSKNCSIYGKNCEISDPYNFWTPIKSNIPVSLMFETETVGPCLVWKLKWGGGGDWPPWPPRGYAPDIVFFIPFHIFFFLNIFLKKSSKIKYFKSVDERFLHCLFLMCTFISFLGSFNLTNFCMNWFLTNIDFFTPEVIQGLSLNLNLFLEGHKCKVDLILIYSSPIFFIFTGLGNKKN